MIIRNPEWAFQCAVHHVVHSRWGRQKLLRNHDWDETRFVNLRFPDDEGDAEACDG